VRRLALVALVLCLALPAFARERISVWCEAGNGTVTVGGLSATTKFMQSYPASTVSVFDTGTTNLSTIYSDNAGTVKANPFTCASDGFAFFYASNGRYDIKLSGTGITTPFTKADYLLFDPVQFTYIVSAMAFNATPTFDAGAASIFTMTLTGNVTSSTINNSVVGQTIFFSLCQDGAGGRTFSWPASFIHPPPVNTTASSCSNAAFFYDGTNWRHTGSGDSGGFAGDVTVTGGITVSGSASIGGGATVSGAINPIGGFSGNVSPNANNTYDLGTSILKWRDLWLSRNLSMNGNLTGATLNSVGNGNTVTLLGAIDNSGAIVGTGALANVFSDTLTGNTVGAGKAVRYTIALQHTNVASVTYQFNFGACSLSAGAGTLNLGTWIITVRNKTGVTNAQTVSLIGNINTASPVANSGTCAIDTTTNQTVTFQFNVAATDSVTPIQFLKESLQ
jgi:hypothetical protein